MRSVSGLELIAGRGIAGDVNVDPRSPRQILLASSPFLHERKLKPGDIRENIVLDEIVESFSSGQLLRLGRSAVVRMTYPCEPCHRLEDVQKGLAKALLGRRGMLARVLVSGMVDIGDKVRLLTPRLKTIPTEPAARLSACVNEVPAGQVVTYQSLIVALGFARSYLRVLPHYIKRAVSGTPVHRIVSSDGSLIADDHVRQRKLLALEGVELDRTGRVGREYHWDPLFFFQDEVTIQISKTKHRLSAYTYTTGQNFNARFSGE